MIQDIRHDEVEVGGGGDMRGDATAKRARYESDSEDISSSTTEPPPVYHQTGVEGHSDNPFRSAEDGDSLPGSQQESKDTHPASMLLEDEGIEGLIETKRLDIHPLLKGLFILVIGPFIIAAFAIAAAGALIYGTGQLLVGVGDIMTGGPLKKKALQAWRERRQRKARSANRDMATQV